jgi:hypothetical protein
VRDERLLAAARERRIALDRGERLGAPSGDHRTRGAGLREPTLRHQVRRAEEEHAARRRAVAPRASGLLVVGLDAARSLEVGDQADVGQVDPHPEGVGRDQHARAPGLERELCALACERGAAGVIVARADPGRTQLAGDALGDLARAAVDDRPSPTRWSSLAFGSLRETCRASLSQPRRFELRHERGEAQLVRAQRAHREREVRAVEARAHDLGAREAEAALDLGQHDRGGRRGERDHRRARELAQLGELHVLGPEVVAPLRHAVRLVDRVERDARALEHAPEARQRRALRRDVEELELAAQEARDRVALRRGVLLAVQRRDARTARRERAHLIAHQRDQRRDDDRRALTAPARHERGHLITQRLARARRLEHHHVAPRERGVHRLRLPRAKLLVAEDGLENLARGVPRRRVEHTQEVSRPRRANHLASSMRSSGQANQTDQGERQRILLGSRRSGGTQDPVQEPCPRYRAASGRRFRPISRTRASAAAGSERNRFRSSIAR